MVPFGTAADIGWLRQGEADLEGTAYRPCLRKFIKCIWVEPEKATFEYKIPMPPDNRMGTRVSEASLNGFPSRQIPEKVQEDPYRILICAEKFQTGYDEPLLNTMYVDKTLAGI